MTVCQSYLGQMQPPCEDQMLGAGQYQGSDDSDSDNRKVVDQEKGAVAKGDEAKDKKEIEGQEDDEDEMVF